MYNIKFYCPKNKCNFVLPNYYFHETKIITISFAIIKI